MSTARFVDHFLKGIHSARPAANTVPKGAKYACSDHGLVYESDSVSTWSTWFDPTAAITATKTINAQTGTTYTVVLADAARGAFLTLSNASAITLTVPTNATTAFPIGSVIEFEQLGAGQVTVAPAGGVTVNPSARLKTADQYSVAGLIKTATDTWTLYGRTSA